MSTRNAGSPTPIVTSNKQAKPGAAATPTSKYEDLINAKNDKKQRTDISVRLQYLTDDPLYQHEKPVQVTPPFPKSSRTNVRLSPGPVETLHDVRGREAEFSLDDNGFCYVHAPTQFKNWSSQPQIAKDFLPEMEALLKREVEGCDEVIFYDARIRQESDEGVRVQGLSYNPFARQVHVDNTETSVIEKIRNITEMKADYHLSGRARIINIWRPIKHPVYDCGLAIADGGSLKPGDVLECDRVRQDTNEYWDTMGVIRYRPGFDWYYMHLQDEADVLLFKNYDSATDVGARYCLHTAFDVPPEQVPLNAPTRESIEVRALIFTHPRGVRKPSWAATPHPLASQLEQGNLKLVDEEHSITDRLRTDIDEGHEVKDAMLLLRRQEIRRLERIRETLLSQQEDLETELKEARQQIEVQNAYAEALQSKVHRLEQQILQNPRYHRNEIDMLEKQLIDFSMFEQTRARIQSDGLHYGSSVAGDHRMPSSDVEVMLAHMKCQQAEVALLRERAQSQAFEIEDWKDEASRRANEAVSRNWQASVDEAVQRERDKDSFVMKHLHDEIQRLEKLTETR